MSPEYLVVTYTGKYHFNSIPSIPACIQVDIILPLLQINKSKLPGCQKYRCVILLPVNSLILTFNL